MVKEVPGKPMCMKSFISYARAAALGDLAFVAKS
jgi:hypothetical protein